MWSPETCIHSPALSVSAVTNTSTFILDKPSVLISCIYCYNGMTTVVNWTAFISHVYHRLGSQMNVSHSPAFSLSSIWESTLHRFDLIHLVSVLSSSLLIGFCLPYVVKKTMLIFCESCWLTVSLSSKFAEFDAKKNPDKFYLKPSWVIFYKY